MASDSRHSNCANSDGADNENEMQCVGNGRRGYVDGNESEAEINRPFDICALRDGTLAFTDSHNNAVRFVVEETAISKARHRYFVKSVENSGLLAPKGIAASTDERHLFVCDTGHHKVKLAALPSRSALAEVTDGVEMFAFAGSGKKGWGDGPALECSFNSPAGVCEYMDGTIIVADTGNHCIRQIRRAANRKLVVKTIAGGYAFVQTKRGDTQRLIRNGILAAGKRISGHQDGIHSLFRSPSAVIAGANGELLVADTMNNCIRGVLPPSDGNSPWEVRTVCGQTRPGYADGNCEAALFDQPVALCWGASGENNSFFVTDRGNTCIRQVGRSYQAFDDPLSYGWVRTIEVSSVPQTPRSISNQELQCLVLLGIACIPQHSTQDGEIVGPQLVVCDGGDNVIKLLPLEETTRQVLNVKARSSPARPASSPLRLSLSEAQSYERSEHSLVMEQSPLKASYADYADLSENQCESDWGAVAPSDLAPLLAQALEENAALKAENLRLRELLQSTFDEIERADKRFSENFQAHIDVT